MAREITAGILLSLKDRFSSQIKGAGISVQGFADKAVGVANRVNQAFSGLAGTLGALGVSVGIMGTVKSTIDLDHRMARLGLTANASAAQVNALKRQIFEAAQMPDIKLNPDEIIAGLEVVMTKVGDLQFVEANVRNIALAIQASGESGDAMGAVFAEFAKFGYTMEEILPLMNDLIAQGDKGAFTFGEFAKNAPAVFSAYSAIGTTPEHIRKANAAMQILMAGTKSADIAVTALNSAMAELSEPDRQKKLAALGINVRNSNGDFRDFNEIMFDIVAKAEEMGNADFFGTIFGTTSMQAIRAYITQGGRMYDGLVNLGDTMGLLESKSETMANTTVSNLRNLQTAFRNFADKSLTGPLQDLTAWMNELAKDPEKIEAGINLIKNALIGLGAVKLGAGIVSFVANLKSIRGGVNMSGLANAAGGAGIPVHVTNWGGTAGSTKMPGSAPGGVPANKAPGGKPSGNQIGQNRFGMTNRQMAGTAGLAAVSAGIYELPQMMNELEAIEQDETLTNRERGEAKGGAIGDAAGGIAGAAGGAVAATLLSTVLAGALSGTAVGTAFPGIGNVVGFLGGGLVGLATYHFAKKAGRAAGAGIGGALADDDEKPAIPRQATPSSEEIAARWPAYAYSGYRQPVNDLIVTPQGQFSTHPDDYIFAMKNPASLANEVRSVGSVQPSAAPATAGGEIILRSELVIDDRGYRLRQSPIKNTAPYKFAVGSAQNARLIQ